RPIGAATEEDAETVGIESQRRAQFASVGEGQRGSREARIDRKPELVNPGSRNPGAATALALARCPPPVSAIRNRRRVADIRAIVSVLQAVQNPLCPIR